VGKALPLSINSSHEVRFASLLAHRYKRAQKKRKERAPNPKCKEGGGRRGEGRINLRISVKMQQLAVWPSEKNLREKKVKRDNHNPHKSRIPDYR